jgi:hypothetical protein
MPLQVLRASSLLVTAVLVPIVRDRSKLAFVERMYKTKGLGDFLSLGGGGGCPL